MPPEPQQPRVNICDIALRADLQTNSMPTAANKLCTNRKDCLRGDSSSINERHAFGTCKRVRQCHCPRLLTSKAAAMRNDAVH